MSGFITKSRDYQPKLVARDDGFFDVVVDDLVRQGRVSREMGERIVRAIAGTTAGTRSRECAARL